MKRRDRSWTCLRKGFRMKEDKIKNGDLLTEKEHVVRYCRRGTWEREYGSEFTVEPGAFISGSNPDGGISVNWLEYFGKDERVSLQRIRDTSTYRGIRESGKFLKLNVGDIRKVGLEAIQVNLKVVYVGAPPNVSHAEIYPSGSPVFTALALCAERHGTLLDVPPSRQ